MTRWLTEYWGKGNPEIVDELGADDLVFSYPLHGELHHGLEPVKEMLTGFVEAFPDLSFDVVGDLVAEGDYMVGRWEGGGTHTGPAFSDRQRAFVEACRRWAIGPVPMRVAKRSGGRKIPVPVCLGWHWQPYKYTRTAAGDGYTPTRP